MDSHAQLEIREYATAIGQEIVRPLFPLVWEAFVDYRLEAMYLTRLDRGVIQRLVERPARRAHEKQSCWRCGSGWQNKPAIANGTEELPRASWKCSVCWSA